jgi:hypothetical protein
MRCIQQEFQTAGDFSRIHGLKELRSFSARSVESSSVELVVVD